MKVIAVVPASNEEVDSIADVVRGAAPHVSDTTRNVLRAVFYRFAPCPR